jgi:hypothetical protein
MNRSFGGESWRDGTVKCVWEDEAEVELELPARELGCEAEKDADAAADAKEECAVGGRGSGATVLSKLSQ